MQWRPPDLEWIKLNVDGAFSQALQRAGGRGVIRGHDGEIVAAFSAGFEGCKSGLEAEVSAILVGVVHAKQHDNRIWIEADAEKVVHWLSSDQLGPADVCTEMARIRKEVHGLEWKVSHIFREGNKAADLLAGAGAQPRTQVVYTRSSTPLRVKALCRLDQLGFRIFGFDSFACRIQFGARFFYSLVFVSSCCNGLCVSFVMC